MKKKPRDLEEVDWKKAIPVEMRPTMEGLLACKRCFPEETGRPTVPICLTCRAAFDRLRIPQACMGNTMDIGCEHRYPEELRELTPLEEKLISLNAAYGFITKFNVQRGQLTGTTYRKHIAGHITVFPNDVESLVTMILPHPLVSALDQVHVIWTGVERPTPRDVSKLLSVRPAALRSALQWLRENNSLYADIVVDEEEMAGWIFEGGSHVPTLAYQRMVRELETAEELIRTAQIVPPTDRGQDNPVQQPTVEDVVMELVEGAIRRPTQPEPVVSVREFSLEEATAVETSNQVFELRSSAMFPIDDQAAFSEQDKLEFISSALQADDGPDDHTEGELGILPFMQVHGSSERPFIWVSRGVEFADAFSPDFFPKTFPSCFPHGRGGPRVADRNDAGDPANPQLRDMTLESWTRGVLQRHGGHCAQHAAFSFLIFNMSVRSRNRRIAHGRLKRSAFRRVAGIHRRLNADRIREAQREMVETGKTTDGDIIALMRELSLYGSRHPLSNETRLTMREKIRAMIIAIGVTAIWITINPNDINSPVKLKLAAYRGRSEEAARALLDSLSTSLQVTTLSVHDPLSSTLFFFREILLFFEYYVRAGEPSVFGKVSHYYATVETNDRGALHLHGLLWMEGNLALPDLVRDMANPDEEEYRLKVKNYVDNVFTETLNETLAKEAVQCGKKTTVVEPELMHDAEQLSGDFDREANFVASRCQVHHHSATCVKYSIKEVLKGGGAKCESQLCRFRAPWRLVPETGFTEEGLLEVRRDHQMVNRYNQSMAIGLRHNVDVSMILTRKKGLALMHYICNYATKLNAPMWKRLAAAAELSDLISQQQQGEEETLRRLEKKRNRSCCASRTGSSRAGNYHNRSPEKGEVSLERHHTDSIFTDRSVFLDERGTRLQEVEGQQHFQYVGGEGGTGKSRVIHTIKDMFRLKDRAAALIGGVTLHSATNIGFEGKNEMIRNVSEEEKLRWKNKVMLVVDEISQVGGLTLASVDSRLRLNREDAQRPFGGIPIVLFFGDFFQFDPVRQTSLLLAEPKGGDRLRPESLAKHVAAHRLFLQFTTVAILREQVRTAGCARLRGFLRRLRSGHQTELDFQRLCRRLYNQSSQPSFADGLRAITPLNQDRWNMNMAAIVQWARAHSKHVSIFAAKHHTEAGRRLNVEDLCNMLCYGDNSHLPTPGLFFYAQGMPVVVTRNQLTGLKLVNGAPFRAVDIIPDLAFRTIALASDVTLHLGPPAAVLLQSDDIADLGIPGLPKGTILVKSKMVAIPESMRGKNPTWRGKPGFERVTHRTGPQCTPAFAMTDQKSQGKQFPEVLVNLKGGHGSGMMTRLSFMSLYVQLSRAERWEGLYLFREPARADFIEPKIVLDSGMRAAVLKLERLGNETRQRFERDHRHESRPMRAK
ncbi:hypothetical protein VDGE_30528 [Verticillium dahliae]|uniref:ATP-dependent DNA helicase n=1 Tax=Verticillium dahliae TaxID=27337 RepID=A0A444RL27_VERDA|nr:hypothetical protein VDGE_30528 [Verticillium dahliae]